MVQDIVCTRRHVLAPVAWLMIKSPRRQDWTVELIRFLSECPDEFPDLDARLAEMAANPEWIGADAAYEFWAGRDLPPSPGVWRTLTGVKSVWTRASTYATLPARCEPAWKETLLRDLRAASTPLPRADFDAYWPVWTPTTSTCGSARRPS